MNLRQQITSDIQRLDEKSLRSLREFLSFLIYSYENDSEPDEYDYELASKADEHAGEEAVSIEAAMFTSNIHWQKIL